ncbi:MAG: hypothetical protein HFG71_15305, partial [Hungatella sp.]|nr:hypothetical protein [Hungatella sp.]
MRLIAKKPCSFGGRQFYIGDEIPENLVADGKRQEEYGVITIVKDSEGLSGGQPDSLFTQEQVEKMLAEAIEEAVDNTVRDMKKEQEELLTYVAELKETEPGAYEGAIPISVKGESDEQQTTVFATPEEIQQVFSIMQMTATEGAEVIAGVKSENILILLHGADSRKTVKNAAKEQADKLFSTERVSNESAGGNATTGTNTEG